jgi:hypothetical protein
LVAIAVLVGCSAGGGHGVDDVTRARIAVDQRLAGRWKLVSFVPDEQLNPVMSAMVAFQHDRLVVTFDRGRIRSESASLTFDRAYRIEDPTKVPFRLILTDEQGVSYETYSSFDQAGRLHFRSVTAPWKGRGMLQREDPAEYPGQPPTPY